MLYRNKLMVLVPYKDADGLKQLAVLNFRGETIPRKSVEKEIKKFVKHNFGASVGRQWIRYACTFVEGADNPVPASEAAVEEWIKRIEYNEDEDEPDTSGEGAPSGETEGTLQALPDQDQAH